MMDPKKLSSILIFAGVLFCHINQFETEIISKWERRRALVEQQKLDHSLDVQLIEYEKFLIEQQVQLEANKQEQLRQLQESQVQLFRTQQQQEKMIAEYQAGLTNQKVAHLNQNRPAGQTVAELKASLPVIAEDAALGGATSNSRRKIMHNQKIEQQLRFEESKRQILHQQQLQIDAMNLQNQIQAETRNDQQEAFIAEKLEIENQQADQRDQLYSLIEAQRMERVSKALELQQEINEVSYEGDEVPELKISDEGIKEAQFARLLQSEERQKAFEIQSAQRQERYLRIQRERLNARKDDQLRSAQKLQQILHETQEQQEVFEKNYQLNLEDQKQEQLRQSKVIQEQLHATQRQLEAQNENQHGVMVFEASQKAEASGDQQTRNQKMIIKAHQERVRLSHKMQQNHRLTQDQDHVNTKADIQLQQQSQKDHMNNQHSIQFSERLRQKDYLKTLRNSLLAELSKNKPVEVSHQHDEQPEPIQFQEQNIQQEVINPETIYLEPRFFLKDSKKVEPLTENIGKSSFVLPETKLVTIVETKKIDEPIISRESIQNKTVEVSCENKNDGMYRDENECGSYYVCTNKNIYKFACPSGTSFNMEHCTCDWPTETTKCVTPLLDNQCIKKNEKIEEIEVKTETEVEVEDQWAPFSCKNKDKGFYRDPTECSKFYYCEVFNKPAPLTGQTIIKNDFYCPNNFHFDVFTCKCGQPTEKSCSNYALTTYCTHSS